MRKASGTPGWKPLTGLEEADAGHLLGALLTTFDAPDAGVLIEEYLPVWLGLDNSYAEEGEDRLRYFAELEEALRRVKARIAVISSPGYVGTSAEGWIWNYIGRFEVGATGPAVQHAKLWMFHRAPRARAKPEMLEIVISSGNLTRDGLCGQIQAGWRCVLPLDPDGSDAKARSWGVLPAFLAELGKSIGTGGAELMGTWLQLLRRCACPDGVELVASVPGVHAAATLARPGTAWGAAGLGALWHGTGSPQIAAMAPTIGNWSIESFEAWTEVVGVKPGRVSVAWVNDVHDWAPRWQLDARSEAALTQSGVRWLEIPRAHRDDWASPFCDEHQETDTRWSHAKLYELREGTRRRLLITSANLSRAAWGDPRPGGGLVLDNFELGVVVPIRDGFSDRLGHGPYARATCEPDYARPRELAIAWLTAEWDGRTLRIECRPGGGVVLAPHIEVTVAPSAKTQSVPVTWSRTAVAHTHVPWPLEWGTPVLASVAPEQGDARETAVHDVRKTDDGSIVCGEFDEARLRDMLDTLIEEKYGYRPPVEGESGTETNGGSRKGDSRPRGADYAVPAYVDARRRFSFIDNWWHELCAVDERVRPFVLADGKRILERWRGAADSAGDRGLRLAARLAAEELALRIRRLA